MKWTLFVTMWLAMISNTYAQTVDVQKLLEGSDRTRGGIKGGVQWKVRLTSVEDGENYERLFLVRSKNEDALVETLEPARYKGEVFVFNGRTIWFYKSGIKKPIAISSRQKLSGLAANGDIASTNYARDYSGEFVKMEEVTGKDCYLLHLKAKTKDSTYDQIDYWIERKTGFALKAHFLALSGKVLKKAEFKYDNKVKSKTGSLLPFVSEMLITDSQNPDLRSQMTYDPPALAELKDSIFNINNLVR